MSYRIQYESIQERQKLRFSAVRRGMLTVFCFFLFLMVVFHLWPEAAETVYNVLALFRPVHMVGAIDNIAHSLQDGAGITQSIGTFVYCFLQEMDFGLY